MFKAERTILQGINGNISFITITKKFQHYRILPSCHGRQTRESSFIFLIKQNKKSRHWELSYFFLKHLHMGKKIKWYRKAKQLHPSLCGLDIFPFQTSCWDLIDPFRGGDLSSSQTRKSSLSWGELMPWQACRLVPHALSCPSAFYHEIMQKENPHHILVILDFPASRTVSQSISIDY